MDNPVPIALKHAPGRAFRLVMQPPAAARRIAGIGGSRGRRNQTIGGVHGGKLQAHGPTRNVIANGKSFKRKGFPQIGTSKY